MHIETGETHQLTSGMFSDRSPTFDRKGDYLYYASARVVTNPIYDNFGNSFVYNGSHVLLAVPLRADAKYPWALEKDEETWDDDKANDGDNEKGDKADKDEPADDTKEGTDAKDNGEETAEEEQALVDDGISGVWDGQVTGSEPLPPGGLPFTMMLRSTEGEVSGTLRAGIFYATVADGAFDQDTGTFTFTLEVTTPDEVTTISGSAQVSGETMNGALTGEDSKARSKRHAPAAKFPKTRPAMKLKPTRIKTKTRSSRSKSSLTASNVGGCNCRSIADTWAGFPSTTRTSSSSSAMASPVPPKSPASSCSTSTMTSAKRRPS